MPTYTITAPNGKTYSIEGPDGATQQDVIREVVNQYPEAAIPAGKMRIYSLKAPDGQIYDLEAPEGTSEEQLRASLYQLRPEAAVAPVTIREILPDESEQTEAIVKTPAQIEASNNVAEQLVLQVKSSLGLIDENEVVARHGEVVSITIAIVLTAVIIFNFYKKIILPNYTSMQKVLGYIILVCIANWMVRVINELIAYNKLGLPIRENILLSVSLSLALVPACYLIIWLLSLLKSKDN